MKIATMGRCGVLGVVLRGGGGAVPVFATWADLKTAVNSYLVNSSVGFCPLPRGGVSIGAREVSALTRLMAMFHLACALTRHFCVERCTWVTSMQDVFLSASAFLLNTTVWNVGVVAYMANMFIECVWFPDIRERVAIGVPIMSRSSTVRFGEREFHHINENCFIPTRDMKTCGQKEPKK